MQHYNFIATNEQLEMELKEIGDFISSFPDFQSVILYNDQELEALFNLIGIKQITEKKLSNPNFSKYWDLSAYKLPELSQDEFDKLYIEWLEISSRENNMDEYGNLIFLIGKSKDWNKLKYRYVVKEI